MKCFVKPDGLPWLTLDAVTGSYLKNIFTIKDDTAEVTCVFQKECIKKLGKAVHQV